MKKLLLSILTLVYMTASAGVGIDIHYCMGKETSVNIYKTSEGEKCGKCGMAAMKGCCKSDHHFFKMEDGFKNTSHSITFDAAYQLFPVQYFDFNELPHYVNTKGPAPINSPPGKFPPIFVRNCNFRI